MKKEFIYNITLLILTNLLVKPLYIFGIEAGVQNMLGPSEYGLYFSLYGLVLVFQWINEPGIQNHNAVYLSKNNNKAIHHMPRLLGLKLMLLLIFLLAVLLTATIIGYHNKALVYVTGIGGILFLSTLYILLRSSLSSLGKYRTDTWLSSLDKFLLILVLGIFLLGKIPFGLEGFIGIQLIVYAFCCLLVLGLLKKNDLPIKPKFDLTYSRQFIKSGLPFALLILLTGVVTRMDSVLLERWCEDGSYQAGLYAAAYRFADAANMFGLLFGALLLPMYGNHLKDANKTNELFDISFRMLLVLSTLIAIMLTWFSSNIIDTLYSNEYIGAIAAMKILMISVVPIIFTHAFGSLIMTHQKIKEYNWVLMIAAVVSFVLNVVLIPRLGVMGAASTSVISQYLILIGLIWITYHHRLVKLEKKLWIKCMLFLTSGFFIAYMLHYFLPFFWVINAMIISTVWLGLAWVSGMFTINVRWLKTKE